MKNLVFQTGMTLVMTVAEAAAVDPNTLKHEFEGNTLRIFLEGRVLFYRISDQGAVESYTLKHL